MTTNRRQALEAPDIIHNPETDYYGLFLACDELVVAYNTRVARSKKITGTYLGIDEQDITTGAECWPMLTHRYQFHEHHGWVAISHWAVFQNPESEQ